MNIAKSLLFLVHCKRLTLLTAYLEDRPIDLFDMWASDQDPAFKEAFYRELPELKARGKTAIAVRHDGPTSALFEPAVYRPPEKAG